MPEGRVDDQMIEIGDPTEESTADDLKPQVVIEYHERGGIPWMLVPPLLVLSAVGSILLYTRFSPRAHAPIASTTPAEVNDVPEPVPQVQIAATPDPSVLIREPVVAPTPKLDEVAPPAVVTLPPVQSADGLPTIAAEPPTEPVKATEPAPPVRVQGLGFDPKALENDRRDEPRADPALAPVVREEGPGEPVQPREVDPELLPPDPRQARLRQEERRIEVLQRINEERSRYHGELKVICTKLRENSGPAILDMWKQYNVKTDPLAEKRAVELLGKNGKFASADRRMRIDLLRSLGFPEPVILDYVFANYEKRQIGERDGPRDLSEAYQRSALFLLTNPPRPPGSASRPVSTPGSRSLGGARPGR